MFRISISALVMSQLYSWCIRMISLLLTVIVSYSALPQDLCNNKDIILIRGYDYNLNTIIDIVVKL